MTQPLFDNLDHNLLPPPVPDSQVPDVRDMPDELWIRPMVVIDTKGKT